MKFDREDLLLYAVTDSRWLNGERLYDQVEKALKGGATFIQLREKELDQEHFFEEAVEIKELCARYHVPFVINDNVEIALKMDADGVHVGQSDMEISKVREILGENAVIGVTAKTVEQAKAAEAAGATYLGSGAVFGTSTKSDAKPMSFELFRQICESVSIPVVAIGGICGENLPQLTGQKMAGIAVVSGIFASDDIEAETRKLRQKMDDILEKHI